MRQMRTTSPVYPYSEALLLLLSAFNPTSVAFPPDEVLLMIEVVSVTSGASVLLFTVEVVVVVSLMLVIFSGMFVTLTATNGFCVVELVPITSAVVVVSGDVVVVVGSTLSEQLLSTAASLEK